MDYNQRYKTNAGGEKMNKISIKFKINWNNKGNGFEQDKGKVYKQCLSLLLKNNNGRNK